MTAMMEDVLYASHTSTPGFDIGCDVLVDALERDAVMAKVRRRGEVEVVDVARKPVPKTKREFGLKVVDLGDM